MRIAQVAPLFESVPPKLYGGTERVVHYLTEELVALGHDVTLYASGDSQTSAKLVSPCRRSLRLDKGCVDTLAHHILMLEQVIADAARYDVVHWHIDYLHFPVSRRLVGPHVTTLHGRLDIPDLPALYQEFTDVPVVSISDSQREPLPWAKWVGTVYHGLPENELTPGDGKGGYLAFLGRISREKRPDRAIEIARKTGRKLKIAAKVDNADRKYYAEEIEPLIRAAGALVEFVGEVGGADKNAFLAGAEALLFPIDWPEPFGLVMIEAMACGTPVIAFPCGSVPEVMEDGVTGFVVDSVEAAADAVGRVGSLDRRSVRAAFERRFTARRMASDYVALYQRLMAAGAGRTAVPTAKSL
jgi:glycosyltransferase involved in cell wall biosynthesis